MKLYWFFQTLEKVYFVMDFLKGGDLFKYLNKIKILSEEHARFYVAQIILALQHLNEKNMVFRDLKPENILLDE